MLYRNEEITKRTAVSHVKKIHADTTGEERFIIVVNTQYSSPYWMVLLAKRNATLADLDDSLRDIWVECCCHLSAFTIQGTEYEAKSHVMDEYSLKSKIPKGKIEKVLSTGVVFLYEYDFGTTTELMLKVADSIIWKKEPEKIVMATMNKKPGMYKVILTITNPYGKAVSEKTVEVWD